MALTPSDAEIDAVFSPLTVTAMEKALIRTLYIGMERLVRVENPGRDLGMTPATFLADLASLLAPP